MIRRAKAIKFSVFFLIGLLMIHLTGCKSYSYGPTYRIITPSGLNIDVQTQDKQLLTIEGTEQYWLECSQDRKILYIKEETEHKTVFQTKIRGKTFRANADADGMLWLCTEKWDIGGFYVGMYSRGYIVGTPVMTELWKIDPDTGEILFHNKTGDNLFYLTPKDGLVYYYRPGKKDSHNKKVQNGTIVYKNIENWKGEAEVADVGFAYPPGDTKYLNFRVMEDFIEISGNNSKQEITIEPLEIAIGKQEE